MCVLTACVLLADDAITMLFEVQPGPSDKSFGLHVAALAGIPAPVLVDAKTAFTQLSAAAKACVQRRRTTTTTTATTATSEEQPTASGVADGRACEDGTANADVAAGASNGGGVKRGRELSQQSSTSCTSTVVSPADGCKRARVA